MVQTTQLDHARERCAWEQREAELNTRLEEMEKGHSAALAGKEMDQMAGEMSGMSQVFTQLCRPRRTNPHRNRISVE